MALVSIPIDQLPALIGNAPPGLNLLKLLIQKSPCPPNPLLRRPTLTQRLEELVKQRRVILLTGSVFKGKTTLAQLVATALCPEAWWINLTERKLSEADNILLALAGQIETGDCPSLVIIDDLDISPTAHRAYRDSLGLVLYRAKAGGRSVILTALGASNTSAVMQDFPNIELLDVPEMTAEETTTLCTQHGCPEMLSEVWGNIVRMTTFGHPKLVQIRIADLASRGWPELNPNDFIAQPPILKPIRQVVRDLLISSVSTSVAEFVYLVSESSLLLRRSIAIKIAESVEGITNAGDVVDSLTGRWFECIEGNWFRATALLQGVVGDVWSPEKRKLGHVRLYKAILANSPLDPPEAAALLFHAFFAQDRALLTHTAIRLQTLENHAVKEKVERQLLWLPFVSLEPGQPFTDDPTTGVILRQLQFQVASTLDADTLPQIIDRWLEEIELVSHPLAKPPILAVAWSSIGFSQNTKVPLKHRLQAVSGIGTLPTELQDIQTGSNRSLLAGEDVSNAGIPPTATTEEMMLLFSNQYVRSAANLEELLNWLENEASDNLRQQFDIMLEWPITQAVGAFIQGAWSATHEETNDWEPWLTLLGRVDDYSKRHASPRFGREAAKARAILLTEYLERSNDALSVLERAVCDFGPSPVLLEQRANCLFHRQDDETVLDIWSHLTSDSATRATLDPFAYRRAGVSAARLQRWGDAERIFLEAVDSIPPGSFDRTKFALKVDAALTRSLGGKQMTAAKLLVEAVLTLPSTAAAEGDQEWDAVQRMAVEVCRVVTKSYWGREGAESRIRPGDASSPILKAPHIEPGQAARTEMMRAHVFLLATTLGVGPSSITTELEALAGSRYLLVRWLASQARLALSYAGAGIGFFRSLLDFETAMADLSSRQESFNPLDADTGPAPNLSVLPERWFGLLLAGIVCSGPNLIPHLERWLDESRNELGEDAVLTKILHLLLDGASRSEEFLETTVRDTRNPEAIRCGAATKLLLNIPAASTTLQLQIYLASKMTSDANGTRQELFNLHAARCFAGAWRAHTENRFQFSSPRTSVPTLLRTVGDVEAGSGTLRKLLQAAASALDQPLGSMMENVR
ncbi:MAG: hypothetical protein E8D47_13205 [Nitrospira sp.]|nr:MAG: hypothetical protein E8D47_13205 [Nitrospira sp.]